MRAPAVIFQGLLAGAAAGLLMLAILFRLNPEIPAVGRALGLGGVVFSAWGVLAVGLPLAGLTVFLRLARRQKLAVGRLPATWLSALVYTLAAVLARVNADLHPSFLSGSAHRTLGQDAVTWLAAALLVYGLGRWVRRRDGAALPVVVFILAVLAVPPLRLVWQPTPPRAELQIAPRPLGTPTRSLVVVGVEGLDPSFLVAHAGGARYPTLERLLTSGSWGPLQPHRPYLMRSLWTTTATGVYPRTHGVESRWAWALPGVFREPVRLLPWTPLGSRGVMPPLLSHAVEPPSSLVPALWQRLDESGVPSPALGWPGIWAPGVVRHPGVDGDEVPDAASALDVDFRRSLELALAPLPQEADEIWSAVEGDQRRLGAARLAMTGSPASLWIELRALGTARRLLQPLGSGDPAQRAALELVLELLDDQLDTLLRLGGPSALGVVVSPYGLEGPDSWERLRRLLGFGGTWHASPEHCRDGVLVLVGHGVVPGHRRARAQLPDVAPTVCYLLGLPVAQYMEGRVILDAVDPEYLAATPLRVVD